MFTCLPYATWRGIWNYASILCVKQSSTISTPMFTFTIFIRYKTIMSTTFIRCTFLKKTSFPSPLPEQNPNDNFILWKPSFPTTQQEHAAAQISMAVKMGDAFWYATWYTHWENQRTSDPKLNVDPNVQGIMILWTCCVCESLKVMDMKNTCHCLLGYSFNIWQFPSSGCKPRSQMFRGKWPPWK